MAHRAAFQFRAHEQRILVAIGAQFAQQEFLPAGFALGPKLFARAAVEGDKSGFLRLGQRFAVHESEHQDVAIRVILHDRRYQPIFLLEIEFHLSLF